MCLGSFFVWGYFMELIIATVGINKHFIFKHNQVFIYFKNKTFVAAVAFTVSLQEILHISSGGKLH